MKPISMNQLFWVGIFSACLAYPCFGQSTTSTGQDYPGQQPVAGSDPFGGARPVKGNGNAGGGSMADFTELIFLIQTIVKGQWELDGGDDKIQGYPNGVWIDPSGKLHRQKQNVKFVPKDLAASASSVTFTEIPQLGAVQASEEVRWISLAELESKLKEKLAGKEMASPSMELLGGLTRIDYLARDPKSNSWFLGGPAGDLVLDRKGNLIGRTTGLPPVLLEDLLSVAPLVLNGRGPLGCSIDPVPERLKAVQQMAVSPIATKSMSQQATKWCERLTETLGDQQATIFGLPDDSPTGIALLVADEHMKRVGLGLETGPPTLKSYWQEAEKRGAIQNSGLIRWWFALRDDIRIGVNDTESVFSLESPTVRVMSQRQWMDHTGARHEANDQDLAADAFAAGFTEQFTELQAMHPAYGRLRHIFDLCVVMRLIREEGVAGHGAKLPFLMDTSIQPHATEPLKWIPSIAAWRKTSNGRVSAIVSGGVAIDVRGATMERLTGHSQPTLAKPFEFK